MTPAKIIHPAVSRKISRTQNREVAAAREAAKEAGSSYGKDSTSYADALIRLAETYLRHGNFGEAEPLLQEALLIDIENGQEQSGHTLETMKKMVTLYRSWQKEKEAQPIAMQMAKLEAELFNANGAQFATRMDSAPQTLGQEILDEFGGSATHGSQTVRWFRGMVIPAVLALLGIIRCLTKTVYYRGFRDYTGPTLSLESRPAAISQGLIILCIATYLYCHYQLGDRDPVTAGYCKFAAIVIAIASCFIFAWAMWTA